MSTDNTKRQPAGIPVGGQFASHDRADAALTLTGASSATANDDWVRQSMAAHQDVLLRDKLMLRAFERIAADHLPVGAKVVFYRSWGDDDYEIEHVLTDGVSAPPSDELFIAFGRMLEEAERVPDDEFDYEDSPDRDGEHRSLTVKAPAAPDRLDATAAIRRASEEAGLGGVMPAVFDVLLDRADGDEAALARYANITPEQITHLYDLVLGPAIDDVHAELEDLEAR